MPPLDATPALSQRVTSIPATNLDDAARLCDPAAPLDPDLDPKLYVDLSATRGGDRLGSLARTIRRAGGGTATLQFLTGHVGTGKTTELRRLAKQLELAYGPAAVAPTVFWLDAGPLVDASDFDLEDLLVALWKLLLDPDTESTTAREQHRDAARGVLIDLWKSQVSDSLRNLSVGGASGLSGLLQKLPGSAKDAIGKLLDLLRVQPVDQRRALRGLLGNLADVLTNGLRQAFEKLRSDETGPVVVLIDNLEKLSVHNAEVVRHVYGQRLGVLRKLDAHLVITTPTFVAYSPMGAGLRANHGGAIVSLPMVKLRERGSPSGQVVAANVAQVIDVLARRVDFGTLFEGGRLAAERLAIASGGVLRDAIALTQSAINEQDDPPITLRSVDRAIGSLQGEIDRTLPERLLPALRHVAATNRFPDACDDDTRFLLLRERFVLEYQNGEPEPFYVVHPLVETNRRLRVIAQ